jgi:uncharacterized protein GlcG (DUF336 family)
LTIQTAYSAKISPRQNIEKFFGSFFQKRTAFLSLLKDGSMSDITLKQAQAIIEGALAHARAAQLMPLLVLVLDARAVPKALAAEDETSRGRYDIAHGKANGALAMGVGSRALGKRAESQPGFMQSLTPTLQGGIVLGPGGVLVRDAAGKIIGAVGVSGDIGDHDEAAAMAGIARAGLVADPGG